MGVMRPELIMKSIIPVVMAGIVGIYGLVIAILIAGGLEEPGVYTLYRFVPFFMISASKMKKKVTKKVKNDRKNMKLFKK